MIILIIFFQKKKKKDNAKKRQFDKFEVIKYTPFCQLKITHIFLLFFLQMNKRLSRCLLGKLIIIKVLGMIL